MLNLMKYNSNDVEIIKYNDKVLFNPYDVGNCLDMKEETVRYHIRNFNENQVIKIKKSDVGSTNNLNIPPSGRSFLTESGVYKLSFKSRKPEAEKFTDWVTDEVLPSIRKTGKYEIDGEQLELEPYKIKNKSYRGVACMTIKDLAFLCGYDRSSVGAYIRENSLGELLTYNKLKDFKRENTDYEDVMCSLYVLYREDVFNIVDNFRKLKECKEFLDEYFKDKYFEPISDMKILKELMNLKMIRQITNNFSLNEQMRMEFDYIISKEYVKLGFLDKPVNDLNINHREGWNLLCNIANWKNGLERK